MECESSSTILNFLLKPITKQPGYFYLAPMICSRGGGGRIWLFFCRKHCEIWKKGQFKHLRANFCKYRKSGASFKIFSFFIFCPNKAFIELFSKIQLKDPRALGFFQNRGKFENRHFGLPPPLKMVKNDAFSCRSCW